MIINSGKDIPFTLQLILGDGEFDEQASVSYVIYDTDGSTVKVSSKSALWSNTLKSYFDNLDVSADWADQTIGNYLLVWTIINAEEGFASTIVDSLTVVPGVIDGNLDITQSLKVILAVLAGTSSGGGTPNIAFKDYLGTSDIVSVVVDRKGNRSAVSISV